MHRLFPMKKIMSKVKLSLYQREDLAVRQGYEKDFYSQETIEGSQFVSMIVVYL